MVMNCPACGAAADPDARFCESCGAVIAQAVAAANAPADAAADRRELDLSPYLGAVSDRGRVHAQNEDAVAVISGISGTSSILVVCDGVSTSQNPALGSGVAAEAAANSLSKSVAAGLDSKEMMWAAVRDAHAAVCDLMPAGTEGSDRPLTTIVAALVRADIATIGWAGDSRAYLLSSGGKLLTRDDSWVNWVVERGDMTAAQAMHAPNAHAITQCLGDPDEAPDPHVVTIALTPGEKLLLCSDGLWNYAPTAAELAAWLAGLPVATPAIDLCRRLVGSANSAGGRDNITAAVLIVPGSEAQG
jgi:serine/threonine protein phosphatase PrpC